MRPVRLQVMGFGTFRDETEVDFTDLELVALVGGTGSGKSTIIDAMTFALFGRIARIVDARRVAPVINAMSTEARVVFTFELGGVEYTAARVVRTTSTKGSTRTGASTKEARLESCGVVLADAADEVGAKVEELTGLNFERFTRVVVLPQGKFAAFLHDGKTARRDLLRSVLGLELYKNLAARAREVSKEAATKLEVLRPKLEAGGVSDEEFAALEQERVAVATAKLSLDEALETRRASIEARDDAAKVAHDFGVLVLAVANVDVPPAVVALGDKLAAAAAVRAAAADDLAQAEAAAEATEQACKDGPDLGECRRLLGLRSDLVEATGAADKLASELEAAAAARDESAALVADLEAKLAQADDRVVEAEAAEKTALEAVLQGPARADLERFKAIVDLVPAIEAEVEPAQAAVAAAANDAEIATEQLRATEEQVAKAVGEVRRIENQNHAHVLVGSLVTGEACPVCQQTVDHIPDSKPSGELDAATAAQSNAEEALREARKGAGQADKQHAAAESALAGVTTRLEAARNEASAVPATGELEALAAEIERLEAAVASATADREQASAAARALRDSDEVRTARSQAESTSLTATRLEAELAVEQKRAQELQTQLVAKPSQEELTAMVSQAEQLATSHNEAVNAKKTAIQESKSAIDAVTELQESERTLRQEFTSRWAPFQAIDAPAPQESSLLDDWQAFTDWASTQQAPLQDEYANALQGVEAAEAKVVNDEEAIGSLLADVEDADGAPIDDLASFMVKRLAQAEAAVTAAEARRKELEADVAQVEQLEESQQVHDMLGNRLLKSGGFEQWMMEEVVQALVERASERLFELSGGQYSIESDDMDFQVRDHRNADELRDARTLSGGETFLASLALALALADSLHAMAPEGTPELESLFLDEGFGTLDPETLDVVAGAIEELGASGRMVGIITHIRELAERMPVRFEVTKEASSSVVARVEA
jgi:exonuclease SbcC